MHGRRRPRKRPSDLAAAAPLSLSEWDDTQLNEALAPDRPSVPFDDPEGRKIITSMRKSILHACALSLLKQARERVRAHNAKNVLAHYEASFDKSPQDFLVGFAARQKQLPYRIGGKTIVWASPLHAATVSRRRLLDAVSSLSPQTACEVGFGSGQNLIYFASKLPDTRLSGFELTESGTRLAKKLQSQDLTGTAFGDLFGLRPEDKQAISDIDFRQGSAFSLPCEDKSFDVVFTHSTLEQMHSGIATALSEIRRVARRYVVLHEPFFDVNERWGQLFLICNNYFRLKSSDLRQHGLRPLVLLRQLPVKPTFAYGILVAEAV